VQLGNFDYSDGGAAGSNPDCYPIALVRLLEGSGDLSLSAALLPLALRQEIVYNSPVEVKGESMTANAIDLPQGTLDLLILRTLALGPEHGWAISERIHQVSSQVLQIHQGSLYPALHRLERRGWIRATWGASENNRRAKFYELTKAGRKQLETEKDEWKKLIAAVAQVLETV
jgi:PadR family transcriptional regulator, regulatory protein PadR